MGQGGTIINLQIFDPETHAHQPLARIGEAKHGAADGEYSPHVRVRFEKNRFLVKTCDNIAELEKVLRLRHEIFHGEFLNQNPSPGLDLDAYDTQSDHLMIVDKTTWNVVGTYRLIASAFSDEFYSASEFDLSSLRQLEGVKLELSRACIDKKYRNGAVIHLLWRGIVEYMRAIDASYLFGCSSVKTMDAEFASNMLSYLHQQGALDPALNVEALNEFRFSEEERQKFRNALVTPPSSPEITKSLIPPLFQFYLRAGAKVAGQPALDRHFECTDFFTLLRITDMKKSYERKYLPEPA